ncbi:MAG TPA: SDR family oxidoreductase [Candidatus Binataceae bacterium]|nr:SDR family oxidoreductase [Candidatus Binataceae bacterium]
MDRTYVVTGAASGIGAATARHIRERGGRVIGSDLRNADVIADLATSEGRAALVDGVKRLSSGHIDAILAVAGGGPPETSIQVNFFGAVATLEGLRPLLGNSPAPRAVAVSSIASLNPTDPKLVEACLSLDENLANAAALEFATRVAPIDQMTPAQGLQVGLGLYGNAKYALNCWCRRAAVTADWAGAGILLNAVAPGFIDTPAAAYILSDPERSTAMKQMVPLRNAYPGRPEQMAAMLAWCVSPENSLMTGQVLFVDGGVECSQRGARAW